MGGSASTSGRGASLALQPAATPPQPARREAPRGLLGLLVGPRAGLALGLAAAWLAVLLPHLPTVNPRGLPVSVDTFYYTRFLEMAEGLGLARALQEMSLARPAYLAALYAADRVVGDPFLLMDVLYPLLAYSLLVASVYRAAARLLGRSYAGAAALLAGLGHSVAAFTLNGLQANSLALALAVQLLAVEGAAATALLMLAAALIHPWTHVMYSAGLVLYRWSSRGPRAALITAALAAALAVAEAVARALTGGGVAAATARPLISAGPMPLLGLLRGAHAMGWGSAFSAPLYLTAAASPGPAAAAAVLAAASPLLLLGSMTVTHRLLVNTPLELLAARLLAALPRPLALALVLAAAARFLVVLAAAQPLSGSLWWSIIGEQPPG